MDAGTDGGGEYTHTYMIMFLKFQSGSRQVQVRLWPSSVHANNSGR